MKKNTIAFYSYGLHRLDDLINFSQILSPYFNILFIVEDERYIQILKQKGIQYICLHCYREKLYFKKHFLRHFLNVFQKLKSTSFGQIIFEKIFLTLYRHYSKIGKIIFKEFNIDIFIPISDRHFLIIETGLLHAAKSLNIPIFLPFIVNWSAEANYTMIKNNLNYKLHAYSSLYQKIVFTQYQYQTYKNHYFYQAFIFRALKQLGVLSNMPWISGGGASDLVAIPNKLTLQQYVERGIEKNKLKILGDISYIQLYESLQNKHQIKANICAKYNLQKEKIIIVGLANWWEHHLADEKTHWDIVTHTIESTLKGSNYEYTILLSLHPSMKKENYLFLEKQYPVKLLEERLLTVLPIAELYVADQSTTIPWGILCEIKTVVVSYYKKLDLYQEYTSIVFTDIKETLEDNIKSVLCQNISFEHDWDLLSKEEIFNSNILQKYITTLKELIKKQ